MPISGPTAKAFLKRHGIQDHGYYSHFGAGWHKLLDKLFTELWALGVKPDQIYQVKEKWGALRVYYSAEAGGEIFRGLEGQEGARGAVEAATVAVEKLIIEAEKASEKICDICGEEGSLIKESWVRTRCEKHRESRDDRWSKTLQNI